MLKSVGRVVAEIGFLYWLRCKICFVGPHLWGHEEMTMRLTMMRMRRKGLAEEDEGEEDKVKVKVSVVREKVEAPQKMMAHSEILMVLKSVSYRLVFFLSSSKRCEDSSIWWHEDVLTWAFREMHQWICALRDVIFFGDQACLRWYNHSHLGIMKLISPSRQLAEDSWDFCIIWGDAMSGFKGSKDRKLIRVGWTSYTLLLMLALQAKNVWESTVRTCLSIHLDAGDHGKYSQNFTWQHRSWDVRTYSWHFFRKETFCALGRHFVGIITWVELCRYHECARLSREASKCLSEQQSLLAMTKARQAYVILSILLKEVLVIGFLSGFHSRRSRHSFSETIRILQGMFARQICIRHTSLLLKFLQIVLSAWLPEEIHLKGFLCQARHSNVERWKKC